MPSNKRRKDKSAMKAYSQFIVQAKHNRRLKLSTKHSDYVYLASHHIYPKCLTAEDTSGAELADDTEANLVLLTFEEHVQAHIYLAAVYIDNYGLQTVAKRMLASASMLDGSALAAEAIEQNAKALAERNRSEESRLRSSVVATANNLRSLSEGKHPWTTDVYKAEASARQTLSYSEGKHAFLRPEVKAASARTIKEQAAQGLHHSQTLESRQANSRRALDAVQCPPLLQNYYGSDS